MEAQYLHLITGFTSCSKNNFLILREDSTMELVTQEMFQFENFSKSVVTVHLFAKLTYHVSLAIINFVINLFSKLSFLEIKYYLY